MISTVASKVKPVIAPAVIFAIATLRTVTYETETSPTEIRATEILIARMADRATRVGVTMLG